MTWANTQLLLSELSIGVSEILGILDPLPLLSVPNSQNLPSFSQKLATPSLYWRHLCMAPNDIHNPLRIWWLLKLFSLYKCCTPNFWRIW